MDKTESKKEDTLTPPLSLKGEGGGLAAEPVYEDIGDDIPDAIDAGLEYLAEGGVMPGETSPLPSPEGEGEEYPAYFSYGAMVRLVKAGAAVKIGRTGVSRKPVYQVGVEWYEEVFNAKEWVVKYQKCTPDRRVQIIDGGGMILK